MATQDEFETFGQSTSREQALADPGATNALINAALAAGGLPIIGEAPNDLVNLPGGLVFGGKVFKTATVRELNGSDEEALSRTLKANDTSHFLDVLLTRGVETIGDVPPTPEMLKSLLIGDRDELLLAIRSATYGDTFELEDWECPFCQVKSDLSFNLLTSIDRIELDSPSGDVTITVPLRKGASALVRFPTGEDQMAASNKDYTTTERSSELLRRCVKTLTRADGTVTHIQSYPSAIGTMSIPDRRAVINAIYEQQPGPRFNLIEFKHAECQKDVKLALSMVDMFRELLIGL